MIEFDVIRRRGWAVFLAVAFVGGLGPILSIAEGDDSTSPAVEDERDVRPAHWSFTPPVRPELPAVQDRGWIRNPLDRFVLARMEAQGLHPAPEADRYALARRLSLDLIGLPPTPADVDEFVRDQRSDAYEVFVDRLLKSPHYGERWARRWLDLARYSDTNGYEKDRPRSIWLYRNWVIDALNSDMPFDQFTIEQIAGDMLPSPSQSQRIATGFHRNTMINEEGGIDPQEDRFKRIVDRIGTTGATWLGLTVACAQCHNHKYDPISQREFYGLFALLNQADEIELAVPDDATAVRRAEIESQIAHIEADYENRFPLPSDFLELQFTRWESKAAARARHWTVLTPARFQANGASLALLDDSSILATGDAKKREVFELQFRMNPQRITALRLEAIPHPLLPGGGPGREVIDAPGDFFLSTISASVGPDDESPRVRTPLSRATHSFARAGGGSQMALDDDEQTAWSISGETGRPQMGLFEFQMPVEIGENGRLDVVLTHAMYYPGSLGRFRLSITGDPTPADIEAFPPDVEDVLLIPRDRRSSEQQRTLRRHYLSIVPELAAEHARVAALRASIPRFSTTMVMEERDPKCRRETRLYQRGEFLKPRDVVEPGVPSFLHAWPENAPLDRLGFARWLVGRRNPLVARVVINRHWEALFGRGLVRTTEDFGLRGERPTHPELLDWLAIEFMDRGWSQKEMHRLIVTSATYRQSSRASPESYGRDPANLWLSRAPRFRVDAEIVRDIALASSGLLNPRLHGPSVFAPQPEGVTSSAFGSLAWNTERGENRYRRGLYTFSKRTAPYAAFTTFDAPTGDFCSARRERSNTPLQALTLMNDTVFVEAAQALARRVRKESPPELMDQLTLLFRLCLSRPPTGEELQRMQEFHQRQCSRFRCEELSPAAIAGGVLQSWTFGDGAAGWSAGDGHQLGTVDGKLRLTGTEKGPSFSTKIKAPAGQATLRLRACASISGKGKVILLTARDPQPVESNSVAFDLRPEGWHDYQVELIAKSEIAGLQIDFGSTAGSVDIEKIDLAYGNLPPVGGDLCELAALTSLARVLLNLDSTITRE